MHWICVWSLKPQSNNCTITTQHTLTNIVGCKDCCTHLANLSGHVGCCWLMSLKLTQHVATCHNRVAKVDEGVYSQIPLTPTYKSHLFAQNFCIQLGMWLICKNIWGTYHWVEILGVNIQCWRLSKRKMGNSKILVVIGKLRKKGKSALIKPIAYNF